MRRLSKPETGKSLLWNICKALDEPPRMLAAKLGVEYHELAPLLKHHGNAEGAMDNEIWWRLNDYLAEQLGLVMAAHLELNRALDKERAARVARTSATGRLIVKGNPLAK